LPKYKKWRRKADHKNLDYWTRFLELKNASESEIEELKKEPEMDKAIKALEEVSQDARLKELVELREKNQFAYNADMKEQFVEGVEEGLKQGINQERTLLIKNAAKNGLTVEMISNVLEIPIEIVQEALKS
jgi:predicted transposase/invertase (TIGR01784 family)